MKTSRARLILHIGQHKTGSKALQSFLFHHAPQLKSRGIFYPATESGTYRVRAYEISHYRLFALLRQELMECGDDSQKAADFRKQKEAFCLPFDSLRVFFESLEEERARSRAGTLVLSAEDLFDMHSAHEAEFVRERVDLGVQRLSEQIRESGYDPTVVVYLRRQDHLLAAHYIQYIKGPGESDLDFENFARLFSPRLETGGILESWIRAFGIGQVQVRPYEQALLPAGIVPDFFEKSLGFPVPQEWVPPLPELESANPSPSRDYVEFLRLLKRGETGERSGFSRQDVLETAMAEGKRGGVGEWLSPRARCELLDFHAEGNTRIARLFSGSQGIPFFSEALPEGGGEWREYAGLTTEREKMIREKIRETALRRRTEKKAANNKWPDFLRRRGFLQRRSKST